MNGCLHRVKVLWEEAERAAVVSAVNAINTTSIPRSVSTH